VEKRGTRGHRERFVTDLPRLNNSHKPNCRDSNCSMWDTNPSSARGTTNKIDHESCIPHLGASARVPLKLRCFKVTFLIQCGASGLKRGYRQTRKPRFDPAWSAAVAACSTDTLHVHGNRESRACLFIWPVVLVCLAQPVVVAVQVYIRNPDAPVRLSVSLNPLSLSLQLSATHATDHLLPSALIAVTMTRSRSIKKAGARSKFFPHGQFSYTPALAHPRRSQCHILIWKRLFNASRSSPERQ